jgi:hypothetical protein
MFIVCQRLEDHRPFQQSAQAAIPGSAKRSLFKVEAGINGILPAYGGPLHIYSVSLLSKLRFALGR